MNLSTFGTRDETRISGTQQSDFSAAGHRLRYYAGVDEPIGFANLFHFWHTKAPMKRLTAVFTLAMTVLAAHATLPQPDLIAQIYFAGAQKISSAANANAFANEFCSIQALALRTQTADKLSAFLAGWLQNNSGVVVPDGRARLRPL